MKISSFYLYQIMIAILALPISCKKEYERPDHYSVDLFKNEINEQKKRILSADEALEKSLIVIKSYKTELISSPKINNKTIYIYKINEGKIMKNSKDSISFPMKIISDHDLKIDVAKEDSTNIYLISPKSYKLLIDEFGVKYQILPSAPVL